MQVLMKYYYLTVDRIWANFSCISSLSFLSVSGLAKGHSLPGANQVDLTLTTNGLQGSSCAVYAEVL